MAAPKQYSIPPCGADKVQRPCVIFLWNSGDGYDQKQQQQFEEVLLSRKVRMEQCDAGNPDNKDTHSKLVNVSKKSDFPQIFIKGKRNGLRYIGNGNDINDRIKNKTFDNVFIHCIYDQEYKKEQAARYQRLSEQQLKHKDLYKAKKFCRVSLIYDDNEAGNVLLSNIEALIKAEKKSISKKVEITNEASPSSDKPVTFKDYEWNKDKNWQQIVRKLEFPASYNEEKKKNYVLKRQQKYFKDHVESKSKKAKKEKSVTVPEVEVKSEPAVEPESEVKDDKEAFNEILDKNMVLTKQCDAIKQENEMLKKKLEELQMTMSKVDPKKPGKKEDKGIVYECNVVEVHKPKPEKRIRIQPSVRTSQQKFEDLMKRHQARQQEWEPFEKQLDRQFMKYNGRDYEQWKLKQVRKSNEKEGKHTLDGSDRKMEFDEVEAEHVENKDDGVPMDVITLFSSTVEITKLLQDQQQRTEEVLPHCMELNSASKQLKAEIKNYNKEVPETKTKCDNLSREYMETKDQREGLQQQVKDLVEAINRLIKQENETNHNKCSTSDQLVLLKKELKKFEQILASSQTLSRQYYTFEKSVDDKVKEYNQYFTYKWDLHEQQWWQWDMNGVVYWLRYLIHENKLHISKDSDLADIEQKMSESKITGKSLNDLGKPDLKDLGFITFDDRVRTYQLIRALIEKYPSPQPKIKRDPSMVSVPGSKPGTIIPKEYTCPISGEIMRDPVMAIDNVTYERVNIEQYVTKHGKPPNYEFDCDGTETLISNKGLKYKIDQFLAANPRIKR